MCFSIFKLFRQGGATGEIPSPYIDLLQDGVKFIPAMNVVTIEPVKSPVWLTTVQDTNSMEPLIDAGHTVILSGDPELLDKVAVGNVIVWVKPNGNSRIHSIIEIKEDKDGWFCQTQGLNCAHPDPERIRRADIKWVALGVIWTRANEEQHYNINE